MPDTDRPPQNAPTGDASRSSDTVRALDALLRSGIRMTSQRRLLLKLVDSIRDHPDVDELYRRAQEVDPTISLATVYRTVKIFADAGILTRHEFKDGRARYERAAREHHDHLIDMRNGKVTEFRSPEIERLQAEIAAQHGFRIIDHRLEIYVLPLGED
jgi:Fur family transcriptional regulator, ferric uptake regulator